MPRESSITGWKALCLGNIETFPFMPFWLACGSLAFAAGLSFSFLINFCFFFLIPKWVFIKPCSRTGHAHMVPDAPLPSLEGPLEEPSRLWVIDIDVERVAERWEPPRTRRHGQVPSWRGLAVACVERVFFLFQKNEGSTRLSARKVSSS